MIAYYGSTISKHMTQTPEGFLICRDVPIARIGTQDYLARELGLDACLLLEMRLGEGSGCPLAFQILKGACAVMCGMGTFQEAAIDDDYLEEIRAADSYTVVLP